MHCNLEPEHTSQLFCFFVKTMSKLAGKKHDAVTVINTEKKQKDGNV